MTKAEVMPGPCGFTAVITAEKQVDDSVKLRVETPCKAYAKMMEELGDTFDLEDILFIRPGKDVFHAYAAEHFPAHSTCPVISAILKCAEAEMGFALKRDVTIQFL